MKENESMKELIEQAIEMLQDRQREEADLIYYICKMSDEDRSAISIAYKILYNEK